MSTPVGIGNGSGRRLSFRERAVIALETALANRGIAPLWTFEAPSDGQGTVVSVLLDGEKSLFRLEAAGSDEGAAMFSLAALVERKFDPRREFSA